MNGECITGDKKWGPHSGTYCFCDSDGCNSAGVTKLSLFLFGVVVAIQLAF